MIVGFLRFEKKDAVAVRDEKYSTNISRIYVEVVGL